MKILIDENLSPTLVPWLAAKGIPAVHVVHIGAASTSDAALWQYAFEQDYVVVTVNVGDFMTLASNSLVHPGVIAIRQGSLTREESRAFLEPVIDHVLQTNLDLVNTLIEVHGVGDFEIRTLPDTGPVDAVELQGDESADRSP